MVARLISNAEKTRWVVALMTVWVLLGLTGHDPWRPDEAYTFGVVWRMIAHGQWLIPQLAGEPFAQVPALFHWSAALLGKIFAAVLPAHDAARIASGAWMGVAFWCLGMTSRELYGRGSGRYAVLTLAGCIGLFERAHQLLIDTALLAAVALLLLALAQLSRVRLRSIGLIGIAGAIAFLSKGWMGAVLTISICVGYLLTATRGAVDPTPTHDHTAITGVCAGLLLALAPIAAWALAVHTVAPGALTTWTTVSFSEAFVDRSITETLREIGRHCITFAWFAFPAWPLAAFSARLMQRGFIGGLQQMGFRLPAVAFAIMLPAILLAPTPRTLDLLPLLIPLALLAVPGLDHLKRGQSGFLDWIGIFFFGGAILFFWAYWGALYFGIPPGLRKSQNNFQPGFAESVRILPALLAFALSVIWFAMIRPARRTHKRALVNWTLGVTTVWGVGMLLMLPYLDYGKSFRIPTTSLVAQLPQEVRSGKACISSVGLGDGQRAMFDYLFNITTQRADSTAPIKCDWLIEQANANNLIKREIPAAQFSKIGTFFRPGGKEEPWHLYQRTGASR